MLTYGAGCFLGHFPSMHRLKSADINNVDKDKMKWFIGYMGSFVLVSIIGMIVQFKCVDKSGLEYQRQLLAKQQAEE